MEFEVWIATNWFTLLQSVGIVGSLWYTSKAFKLDAHTRRVSNYLALAEQHREIWALVLTRRELYRILQSSPNLEKKPISAEERLLVTQLIIHVHAVFIARRDRLLDEIEGADDDIRQFFSKPIPRLIWEEISVLQNRDFRNYIETVIDDQLSKNVP